MCPSDVDPSELHRWQLVSGLSTKWPSAEGETRPTFMAGPFAFHFPCIIVPPLSVKPYRAGDFHIALSCSVERAHRLDNVTNRVPNVFVVLTGELAELIRTEIGGSATSAYTQLRPIK